MNIDERFNTCDAPEQHDTELACSAELPEVDQPLVDLPGIVEGMFTHGWGRRRQLAINLKQAQQWKTPWGKGLCREWCKGYRSATKCDLECEYGIIRAATWAAQAGSLADAATQGVQGRPSLPALS